MVKRQGNSKKSSEVSDICSALNTLAENDSLPMFVATYDMIKETPLLTEHTKEIDVGLKLSEIENTIKGFLDKKVEIDAERTVDGQGGSTQTSSNENENAGLTWLGEEDVIWPEDEAGKTASN